MENTYQQQAQQFLAETNTSLKIEFKKYGSMRWDTKGEQRNIYRCTLKNSNGRYSFDFGQSIFGTQNNEVPSEYDVLSCLTKYDPETYEDFCGNYGYDTYSRTAFATYKLVVKEWEGVSKLFNSEELEKLAEIQ